MFKKLSESKKISGKPWKNIFARLKYYKVLDIPLAMLL